jgi:lipoate-protein ligase B
MKVTVRHEPMSPDFVNGRATIFLNNATDNTPDQFWIANNATGSEFYSIGKFEYDPRQEFPKIWNGIPVVRMDRGGKWGWHGPGQISLVMLIKVNRLLRSNPIENLPDALTIVLAQYLTERFGKEYRHNFDDPGVYETDTYAKVVNFGSHMANHSWMAFKCSFNLNIEPTFAKFNAIDLCGVTNRPVANLMPDARLTPDQYHEFAMHVLTEAVWPFLYNEVELVP